MRNMEHERAVHVSVVVCFVLVFKTPSAQHVPRVALACVPCRGSATSGRGWPATGLRCVGTKVKIL